MSIPSIRPVFATGLILAISLSFGLSVQGQIADFEEGNYRKALTGFQELSRSQPTNVMNSYYVGRCLVELNEDIDDAIEYLYNASKRGAPADANFYLGRAYHLDYNFSEALEYYSRFEREASRQQLKDLRVNHMINTCRSALKITASYNQYEVMTVTFLDLADSLSYSQIRMKGGQLQKKPMEYFRTSEERSGLSSLMFMPNKPLRGDYVYYSGAGKPGKGGMQLYRVKKGAGRSWGDPQEIKALNTEGDELLPYYDPIENDLYFASNGGSGVGGFDLYRAHYDPDRDEWTAPINLGFPINSVMDEYLLLPGSDLGMMIFFSNRQGTDSTLTVYRVHLVEPKLKTDPDDTEMLKRVANLGNVADEILAEITALKEQEVGKAVETLSGPSEAGAPDRVYTPIQIVTTPEREYLAEALKRQAVSDSLKDLATEARAMVRVSDDLNDRWVWQKQIMVWEKRAHDEESQADILYTMMEEKSQHPHPVPVVNAPESVPLTGASPSGVEGEPGTQPVMKAVPPAGAASYINRFDILGSSPYTESSPIPSDVALPEGVFYRIQIGVFGQPVSPGAFKGISPITAETLDNRELMKYYAGKFTLYEDASTALSKIRSGGYEDAFVSAWYNGDPISTQRAMQLE
jgi:tetratricopeptide (TPR) repeat protein